MPSTPPKRIVIFGATGRVGRLLVEAFMNEGKQLVTAGRRKTALDELPGETVVADLAAPAQIPRFVQAGDIVINAAHARFTEEIAKQCPQNIARLVVIGSTRYMTRFPDQKAAEVTSAARFLEASTLPWVLLHPTMIYGAEGENNVQRMATLIRRFHFIPLPNGGHSLIQPVHVGDVVASVVSAATKPGIDRETIHLGGPSPVSYADFLRAIAQANNTWVRIVPLPAALIRLVARLTTVVPGIPAIKDAEVLRLLEDKNVGVSAMKKLLGVSPRSLKQGLNDTFHR